MFPFWMNISATRQVAQKINLTTNFSLPLDLPHFFADVARSASHIHLSVLMMLSTSFLCTGDCATELRLPLRNVSNKML